MSASLRWLTAGLVLVGVACSGAGESSTFPGGAGAAGGSGGAAGGGGSGGTLLGDAGPGGSGGGSGGSDGCADATRYVYVVDADNTMYRFDPMVASKAAFIPVGQMGCSAGDGPNSMAVGRDGFAYVLYGSQDLFDPNQYDCAGVYKVDIKTAACAGLSSFHCGSGGFDKFGMGFSTDSANTTAEGLYLSNSLSPRLGKVDLVSGEVASLGNLPGGAEFTGNANGELWGFFPDLQTPAVLQIDKSNGNVLTTLSLGALPPISNSTGYAYAFAFWGGSFYIFYQVDGYDVTTNVWKLETNGAVTKYIPNTGLRIVGAGVSTCAPVKPPS